MQNPYYKIKKNDQKAKKHEEVSPMCSKDWKSTYSTDFLQSVLIMEPFTMINLCNQSKHLAIDEEVREM